MEVEAPSVWISRGTFRLEKRRRMEKKRLTKFIDSQFAVGTGPVQKKLMHEYYSNICFWAVLYDSFLWILKFAENLEIFLKGARNNCV